MKPLPPDTPDRPGAATGPDRDRDPIQGPFDDALRRWATRPPRTPAATAARRIEDRLPPRRAFARAHARRPLLAVAAAVVAAIGLAVLLTWGGSGTPAGSARPGTDRPLAATTPAAASAPSAVPSSNVLVIDLDERTTLYLDLDGELDANLDAHLDPGRPSDRRPGLS